MPQMKATPWTPVRQAVGRRQERVRQIMHTLPQSAQVAIQESLDTTDPGDHTPAYSDSGDGNQGQGNHGYDQNYSNQNYDGQNYDGHNYDNQGYDNQGYDNSGYETGHHDQGTGPAQGRGQ